MRHIAMLFKPYICAPVCVCYCWWKYIYTSQSVNTIISISISILTSIINIITTINEHYCNFEDKCKSTCIQIIIVHLTSFTTTATSLYFKKGRKTKIYMIVLNGCLLFEEHTTKQTKAPKNVQSRGRHNTCYDLVTTAVISKHPYKISTKCFTFLKTLKSIPKIDWKMLHNVPSRGIYAMRFYLAHWLTWAIKEHLYKIS